MIKKKELRQANSCLNKAGDDEPIFVLRAKDVIAPQAIRHWATMSRGIHEAEKISEALKLADEMEKWHSKEFPPLPESAPE